MQDNYVNVSGNLRSPKTLTDLCIDALCRSLPYLDGELPSGLPQDVVDDVSQSLVQHSALTATTLRVLRNCELGTLSLAKCRGVTDAWLEPFLEQRSDGQFGKDSNSIGLIGEANFSLKSSEAPYLHQTSFCDVDIQSDDGCDDETLDDICHDAVMEAINIDNEGKKGASGSDDAFFCKFNPQTTDEDAALSSSTSSFATADECHQHHDHYCMDVEMENENSGSSTAMYNPSWVPSSLTANLTLLDIRGSQELTDRGLLQLTHLGNLQVAKLDQCHALTGRGLLALCHSRQLHTLSLANCRRLMDEAVINISHLNSLRALSLDGCRCLTDRSLAAISELYRLEKLDLSQCDLITDDGLDELEHLQNLQELSLGWCRQITDAGLGRLTSHPGRERMLRVLRLARCTVSDKGIAHLATLLALEELDLNGCFNVVQGAALGQTLQKLRYLTVLDVSHCPGIL